MSMLFSPERKDASGPSTTLRRAGFSRITVNFAWTLAGNALYSGGQWALIVLLAKMTRPEVVGQYALAFAIAFPVLMLTNLQLRAVVSTDVREEVRFGSYLGFRLLSTGLALLVISVIVWILRYPPELTALILLVGLSQAIEAISDVYYGRLQLRDRMDRISKSMIARTVLSLLGLAVAVYLSRSLLWGMICVVVARGVVLLAYDVRRQTHDLPSSRFSPHDALKPLWDPKVQRSLLLFTLPLGVIAVLVSLTSNVPRYFIEHALGERALGIYSSVAFLFAAGNMAVLSLGQSAFTRLANSYASEDSADFQLVLGKLLAVGAAMGISGVILARLAGKEILTLLFRSEYAEHTDLLVTIMMAAAVHYLSSLLGSAATAARFFKPQIPLLAFTVMTSGMASYFLIPKYGLLGAGYTIFITAMALLSGEIVLIWRILVTLLPRAQATVTRNRPPEDSFAIPLRE